MRLITIATLLVLVVAVVRWGYALRGTIGKPPEWEPPRLHVWPFKFKRDGYRRYLALWLVALLLIIAAILVGAWTPFDVR